MKTSKSVKPILLTVSLLGLSLTANAKFILEGNPITYPAPPTSDMGSVQGYKIEQSRNTPPFMQQETAAPQAEIADAKPIQQGAVIKEQAIPEKPLETTAANVETANPMEESVSFPEIAESYLKEGAFVDPNAVKRVKVGLTKDQVRLLLGNPHFHEGIFNVKTWNYIFNFYTSNSGEYTTCQYQVQFDSKKAVSRMIWRDSKCEQYVNLPQKVAEER